MPSPAWLTLLRTKIEEVLSRQHLLKDPYLISQVLPYNLIPISALVSLPSITRLNATESDIIQCCCQSYNLDFLRVDNVGVVSPHFLIVPTILMVKQVKQLGTLFEVGDFVGALAGEARFYAYPANDGNDYAVHFEYREHCIAVWRALRVIQFHGHILDVEVYSPTQPFTITQTRAITPHVTEAKPAAKEKVRDKTRVQNWAAVWGRNGVRVSV
jgi:hypothetical protein